MLQLRGFVPTVDKVKLVEFHPVQPWVAFADKGDAVKVWDWSTQQVLHDLSMGGADDEGAVESAINRSGERDGSFVTNASAATYVPSRVASGHVRQVRFLDAEVAYWQTATAHLMVNGATGAPLPRATAAHALDGTRLLVAVCESKVVLYDLASKKPFEVSKAALDGRAPTCVAFLFRGGPYAPGGSAADPVDSVMASPVLAVGCADGAVRLVHLATLRAVGRLSPGGVIKVGAVSCMAVVPSQQGYRGEAGTSAYGAAAAGLTGAAAGLTGGPAAAGATGATAGPTGGGWRRAAAGLGLSGAAAGPTGGSASGSAGAGGAALPTAASLAATGRPADFVPSRDLLLVGDTSGALLQYDPFGRPLSLARDTPPSRGVDGHAGEVWSLCLAPGPEDDSETAPRIFSCGADKQVVAWDPHMMREMWRVKMDAKAPAASLAYSHRYFNLSGAHALLMTVNTAAVMALYTLTALPVERGLRPCVDLAPLIPPGQKKVPKVYVVATSPMRPNLVAVGANSGMAFLTFDRMYPLPVAPAPLADLAGAHVSPSRTGREGGPDVEYFAQLGDTLWHVSCAAVAKDLGSGPPHMLPAVLRKAPVATMPFTSGRAIVGVSPSGQYVSCCWPAGRRYSVFYRTLSGGWQEVDTGLAVDLAWHSHRDQFAVVEEPQPSMPLLPKSKSLLKSREKEAAKAAAAAAEAAMAASLQTVVRIKALEGIQTRLTCEQMALAGDVPVGVHGGPLIGVSYKRVMTSGSDISGEDSSPVLQLWSWDGRTKFGPELPEPGFVRWDPTVSMVALGYLRQVQLFRARPVFEPLAAVPVAAATSAVWALRQLYVSTTSAVHVAFVAAGESQGPAGRSLMDLDGAGAGGAPAEAAVALVSLAAATGSDATSSLRAETAGAAGAALPAPRPRPPGPLALLGPREGGLWLVNGFGQPMVIPMTHPGLHARCLAAMGDAQGAVQVAAAGLAPAHHDNLASFLAAMAGPTGAHLALMGLPGLSLAMEVELCMATGQWRRALACCAALMQGCADRSHLRFPVDASPPHYAHSTELTAVAAAGIAPRASVLATAAAAPADTAVAGAAAGAAPPLPALGAQPGDPPPPSVAATNQAMWGYMGFGGLFVDNFSQPTEEAAKAQKKAHDPVARGKVDWGAPLGAGWEYKTGGGGKKAVKPAAAEARASAGAGALPPRPGVLAPSPAALRLAMRLVEGSQDAGILDVTAAAAQLLLEHRGSLQPAQLARLAARMAEAGMNADVKLLVDSGVTSGSHNGQAVGFVAAALTGDLQRLQSALSGSGTVALAALQANTYRLPQSMETFTKWNDDLRAASIAGGSQAYLTVVPAGL